MNRQLIRQFGVRNRLLKELGLKNYQEYLKSNIWKQIKQKIANRRTKQKDFWKKCMICGSTRYIQIHHVKYTKIKEVSLHALRPLCNRCHQQIHIISLSSNLSLRVSIKAWRRIYNKFKNNLPYNLIHTDVLKHSQRNSTKTTSKRRR